MKKNKFTKVKMASEKGYAKKSVFGTKANKNDDVMMTDKKKKRKGR